MREIRTSGSTRGRRAADFNPLRVVLLYRPSIRTTFSEACAPPMLAQRQVFQVWVGFDRPRPALHHEG